MRAGDATESKAENANGFAAVELQPRDSPLEYFGNPKDQIRDDFAAVGFVEHFMSSSGVKMMRDICDARFLIALHEKTNALQLQTNWVFTAGKQIDRQVRSNSMQVARVGEFT